MCSGIYAFSFAYPRQVGTAASLVFKTYVITLRVSITVNERLEVRFNKVCVYAGDKINWKISQYRKRKYRACQASA